MVYGRYVCERYGKEEHSGLDSVWVSLRIICEYVGWVLCLTMDKTHWILVSVHKGKTYFAAIKLSARRNSFVWTKLQLDTASTTNTLALDDFQYLCPAAFQIHRLIKLFSAILRTKGGGIKKPVGKSSWSVRLRRNFTTFNFSCLAEVYWVSHHPF